MFLAGCVMAKQVHGGSNPASVRTPAAYLRVIDFIDLGVGVILP